MSRYLITGGAGFIGSNIARRLLADQQEVRVFDNLSTGRLSNLDDIRNDLDFAQGDLRDSDALRRAVEGIDYVFHQAAVPSVQRSVENPMGSHLVNSTGTLDLLIAARDAGVRRVVYAGSSSVYGDSETLPKVETMVPNPISGYAINKISSEYYCRIFPALYGLEAVTLRYFNVFGPYQDPTSEYSAVIPLFVTAYLQGRVPTIYGDGLQARDFTYIDNVVDANLLASTAEDASGHAFNIACGEMISLVDLARTIKEIIGAKGEPVHSAPRKGDVRFSLADITRAREVLGYEPKVSLREGLELTAEFFGALTP
ncbi:MAG: hypothetical protein CME06_02340 [Gemmatimonadetes bacterium]|nr:hypothetical protein [Gemmatimonadota bacterium]